MNNTRVVVLGGVLLAITFYSMLNSHEHSKQEKLHQFRELLKEAEASQ